MIKLFISSVMAANCLELANREYVEVIDELPTGEIGRYDGFSIYKTHESELVAAAPNIDTRKFSKCKRIRRQARGW